MKTRQQIWLVVGLVACGYVLWILLAPRISEIMFLKAVKPIFFVCPNVVHTMTPEQAHIRFRKDPHDKLALRVLQDYYASLGEWQKSLSFGEKLIDRLQGSKCLSRRNLRNGQFRERGSCKEKKFKIFSKNTGPLGSRRTCGGS